MLTPHRITPPASIGPQRVQLWPQDGSINTAALDEIDVPLASQRVADHLSAALAKAGPLVVRRVGTAVRVAVVAPDYIERHGEPTTPADLANHTCIVHDLGTDSDLWTFVTPEGSRSVRVSGGFLANDVRAVHLAARSGYGIAHLVLVEVYDDLLNGHLVRVLSDFQSPGFPFSLVYPSRRHLAPRTRLVMDFICEQVRQVQAELATASDHARTA